MKSNSEGLIIDGIVAYIDRDNIDTDQIIPTEYLKSIRRYVIVIIFAFAAILTPPDPITQVGLAIPLLLLYEVSIFTVKFIEKKKTSENLEDA